LKGRYGYDGGDMKIRIKKIMAGLRREPGPEHLQIIPGFKLLKPENLF
jgi:hypothetical protein